MPRPIVFIHGYSANGTAFNTLRDALIKDCKDRKNITLNSVTDIDICTYVSLNNEVTITDIAEGLDRAFRNHPKLKDDTQEFDVIVHSTGMLVIRAWLANKGAAAITNARLSRLKHLIGIAPATWGSPQASQGRTFLGALVKGNRNLGPDFLNAGDKVLQGLELGSSFTWNLAHQDLLGAEPFYDKGPETPFVSIFIGNRGYPGVDSVANSPGSDGTVRWSGCALNTRKITLDLTRIPLDRDGKNQRYSISPWVGSRTDIPMIALADRDHSSSIADPLPGMVELISDFLEVSDEAAYDGWLARAKIFGEPARQVMLDNPMKGTTLGDKALGLFEHIMGGNAEEPLDGWQQFIVHAIDSHGNGINDYFLEILLEDEHGNLTSCQKILSDVHAYGIDNSFRCFHVRLPQGITAGGKRLVARMHASTGTELLCYQGYGDNQSTLTATADPVQLDISGLATEAESFFCPFTTTLIEVQLNREPKPLHDVSQLLYFLLEDGTKAGVAPAAGGGQGQVIVQSSRQRKYSFRVSSVVVRAPSTGDMHSISISMAGAIPEEQRITELDDIETLVRTYRPRLLRFVAFSTGDQDLAETITQDCFFKAYRTRASFRGDCSAYTWLASIAVNLIKDYQRTEKFRFWRKARNTALDVTEMASMLASGAVSQEAQLLARERAAALASVVETLSANQRRIFLLRFVEEMSVQEICLATGMHLATVKTHIHRSVKIVREKMGAGQ